MVNNKFKRGSLATVAAACVVVCGAAGAARAAVYDAVADFNTTDNPNGVWTYYGSDDATVSTDVLLTPDSGVSSPIVGLSNQRGFGDETFIAKNTGAASVPFNTYELSPDELNMDPQSNAVFIRFTAPTTGLYNVDAVFYGLDHGGRSVAIYENYGTPAAATLMNESESGTGWTDSYNQSRSLSTGDTLDFVVYSPDGNVTYLGTGFSATITSVPEPASLALVGIGGLTMLLRRRR